MSPTRIHFLNHINKKSGQNPIASHLVMMLNGQGENAEENCARDQPVEDFTVDDFLESRPELSPNVTLDLKR